MPIFALSILPSSPKAMGRGGTDIHNKKAFLYALVLTFRELRNFQGSSKAKQQGRPIGCIVYLLLAKLHSCVSIPDAFGLHICISVGLSVARFGDPGNAKAF